MSSGSTSSERHLKAPSQDEAERFLTPGRTCWRLAQADRFALIVDAAGYFAALKAAMMRAQRSILLIGWDFDTRVRLIPGEEDGEWPNKLGEFIDVLVERRPELQVHLLQWNLGVLQTFGRGTMPLFLLNWMTNRRIHLRVDHVHPVGACHHQKIAVIDDAMAFCGGIDITAGRWDTHEHRDVDARRDSPWGFPQPPWHDATTAVDGAAARALGDLARARWAHATGERLDPVAVGHDPWPVDLQPILRNVEVGIARTQPAYGGEDAVHEIEALYVEAIGRARKTIYCESQYFASRRVADAMAERLAELDGPEIVVINPFTAEGWLEDEVMGAARSFHMARLREADRHDRFRLYYPVAAGGTPIYVHAKIMIVDDVFLRVGSSNLNNRSLGLDTECDLGIEAHPGSSDEGTVRAAVRAVQRDLLSEHLATDPGTFAAAQKAANGSMIAAIERLRRPEGRTLSDLDPKPLNEVELQMVETRILDPERPVRPLRALRRRIL